MKLRRVYVAAAVAVALAAAGCANNTESSSAGGQPSASGSAGFNLDNVQKDDALAQQVDVDALLSQLDLNAVIEKIDLNVLLSRVDVQALVERIDIDTIVQDTDLGAAIAMSSGHVAGKAVDILRSQAVSLDDRIDHWVRRLLRRGGPDPAAPQTLLNTEAGT